MSQFNYEQYTTVVSAAKNNTNSNSVRVGFFKLGNDGDEALVRMNVASVDNLDFASVHTVQTNGKWYKISCLNEVGSYSDACPLCEAVANGDNRVQKVGKKVYIQMLASYKDKTTGQWSAPAPVIWERPAGFSREIANKLRDYGDLRQILLKITRNGVAGDTKTTYSMDYAMPAVFKPEMIPTDFSAFNNFKINKHSYWEKTAEDINTLLTTGSFPEVAKSATTATTTAYNQAPAAPVGTYTQPAPTAQVPFDGPYTNTAQPAVNVQPAPAEEKPAAPVRSFNGFSF